MKLMLTRIHHFSWLTASLVAVSVLELSGVFRIGATGAYLTLMLIVLTGFFSVRWFAGFLAFLLLALSFFIAPFWILETGMVALTALLLLVAAPFLTGNRFPDFLILIAAGTCVITIGGAWAHGGTSFQAVLVALAVNLIVAACTFFLVEHNAPEARRFSS